MLSAISASTRLLRNPDVAQNSRTERETVGDGESRDGRNQRSPPSDDQQQRQHEKQMMNPCQDVLHAQEQVRRRNLSRTYGVGNRE